MFVKISSLVVCLVLIQSTLNAAASAPDTGDKHLFILPGGGDVYEGSKVSEQCHYTETMAVVQEWWTRNGKNFTTRKDLVFEKVTSEDSGIYTCNAKLKGGTTISKKIEIRVTVPKITPVKADYVVKVGGNVTLSCLVNKTSSKNFAWWKFGGSKLDSVLSNQNETHYSLKLHLKNVSRNDNGSYVCEAEIGGRIIKNTTHLRVLERPEISKFDVRPVAAGKVRLNWRLFDGNSPVTEYTVFFRAEADERYGSPKKLNVSNCTACSFDLESDNLKKHKSCQFTISTWNSEGNSTTIESRVVNMSMIDPIDTIPMEFNTSKSDRSITINWSIKNLKPNSSYHYSINVTDFRKPGSVRSYNSTDKATRYVIEKLEPLTTYVIKVQGCIDDKGYEKRNKCTGWTERNVTTEPKNGGSSVSRSTEELSLITLTTIVSMFLFKYDDVRSFLSF